jgi:hypothetical protein
MCCDALSVPSMKHMSSRTSSLLNYSTLLQNSRSTHTSSSNAVSFTNHKAMKSFISKSCLFSSSNDAVPIEDESNETTSNTKSKIFDRLLKISNIASFLCVIDCTVLPIITIALPLLGLSASASTAAYLHELGHSVALFFVLPVGTMATTVNYLNHEKKSLLALALVGLTCIYVANGHGGPLLSLIPSKLAHDLHCGTALHRMTNIAGCACLLTSNILGKKAAGGCAVKDCTVDHGNGNASASGNASRSGSGREKVLTFCVDIEQGPRSGCEAGCSHVGQSRMYSRRQDD